MPAVMEKQITLAEMIVNFKLRRVMAALRECHGNQLRAAESLGVHRNTIQRILETRQITSKQIHEWIEQDRA